MTTRRSRSTPLLRLGPLHPRTLPPSLTLALTLLLLLIGCTTPSWDGTVDRWGTLREVLREGDTSGKVEVLATLSPWSHGIGAMEGLHGEIALADGGAWIARGVGGNSVAGEAGSSLPIIAARHAAFGDRAAFLAVTEVFRWQSHPVDRVLDEAALEARIRMLLSDTRFARSPVVPVRIEGPVSWEGHILAGHCPLDPDPPRPGAAPPVEVGGSDDESLVIVGFIASTPPGEITHHGSAFHLHAIFSDLAGVAHVDALTVPPGARILLPAVEPRE